jgi:hypothetical protein
VYIILHYAKSDLEGVRVHIFVERTETPPTGVVIAGNIAGDYLIVTDKERAGVVGYCRLTGVRELETAETGHPGGYYYLHLHNGTGRER